MATAPVPDDYYYFLPIFCECCSDASSVSGDYLALHMSTSIMNLTTCRLRLFRVTSQRTLAGKPRSSYSGLFLLRITSSALLLTPAQGIRPQSANHVVNVTQDRPPKQASTPATQAPTGPPALGMASKLSLLHAQGAGFRSITRVQSSIGSVCVPTRRSRLLVEDSQHAASTLLLLLLLVKRPPCI